MPTQSISGNPGLLFRARSTDRESDNSCAVKQTAPRLPHVSINMGMTADGKIANSNRTLNSFGSCYDKHRLLYLRSHADAVMTGARTAEAPGITLGPGPSKYRRARIARGLSEFNLRVIASGSGSMDPEAEVFQCRFSPIIVLTTDRIKPRNLKRLQSVASVVHICGQERIDFHEAFRWLRKEWKITHLLCEGGGQLNNALFRTHLVHELFLTICPFVLGGRMAPTIADGLDIQKLQDSTFLRLKSMRKRENELFVSYDVLFPQK